MSEIPRTCVEKRRIDPWQPGRVLRKTLQGFIADDGMSMSAAIAYYSAFALAPLLLIAVAIAGAAFGDEAVRGALDGELRQELGPSAALVIQEMVAGAHRPTEGILMSLVGLLLLLVGASALFGQLQASLNRIWNVGSPAVGGLVGFVRDRVLSFSMVLVSGFLLLASMVLTTALQALGERLSKFSNFPIASWMAGAGILSFIVTVVLFAAIFKILPNRSIEWRNVWAGALFTAALFTVGKHGISWYLGREATISSYGSAGAFAVILAWLYYSAIILLLGAEFTKSISDCRLRAEEDSN